MVNFIEVGQKPEFRDSKGHFVKKEIEDDLNIKNIESISYIEIYEISLSLNEKQLQLLGKAFSDPITHHYSINTELSNDYDWEIRVKLKPDVTDNIGLTAVEAIEDVFDLLR